MQAALGAVLLLGIIQGVEFKILHGLGPGYLQNLLHQPTLPEEAGKLCYRRCHQLKNFDWQDPERHFT